MPGPSLDGETVHLKVTYSTNYTPPGGTIVFINQVVYESDLVVGSGVELSAQPISHSFNNGYGLQTLSGSIAVDLNGSGYSAGFNGDQPGGALYFEFSSLNDESIYSVTGATEISESKNFSYGNYSDVSLNSSTSVVTTIINFIGYQPGLSMSEVVGLTYGTAPSGNTAPVASADSYAVNEDATLNVAAAGVLANDTDAQSDPLTAVLVSGPSHGNLTLNANGSFSYTPTANYNGADSFTYKANDGTLSGNTATVSLTVNGVNDAPVANDDTVALDEDTSANFSVLANDTDVDGDVLTVIGVTQGLHGAVTINPDKTIHYVPVADYSGPDSFQYTITDGAISRTATVDVTVRAVNDPPYAFDDTATVAEDGSVAIFVTANDTDADNQPLNIAEISTPGHGSVQLNGDNSITYTPDADFSGVDTFTYKVNDDQGRGSFGESTATVTVTVTAVNDAPVNGVPVAQSTNEDAGLVFSTANGNAIGVSDIDVGGGTMTVTLAATHGALTLGSLAGLTFAAGDGTADATMTFDGTAAAINAALQGLTFDPAANYNGAADVTVTTNDQGNTGTGGALQDADTVAITVVSVNDAPAGTDNTITMNEDGSRTLSATDFGFSDSDGNSLSGVKITTLPGAGTLTLGGVAVSAGDAVTAAQLAASQLVFTPAANANGASYASFTFQVQDDGGTANGGVDLDPSANTLTFDVAAVNDAPVNGVPVAQSTNEDAGLVFSTANGNAIGVSDIDVGGGTMTVTLAATHGALTLGSLAGLTFAAGDGTADATMTFDGTAAAINAALQGLTFDPAANYNGAADVTVTTNDQGNTGTGGALQDADTVAITVVSVNDAPAGTDNTITMNEDGSRTLSATDFGFSDSDGNSLSGVKITTLPGAGTLTLGGVAVSAGDAVTAAQLAASQLVFTPAANANGASYASFTFQVQDDGGTANGGVDLDPSANTLTFDVAAVNDAPVNGVPVAQSTNEDAGLVFSTANGNAIGVSDIDVGGGTMTVTLAATHGALTLGSLAGLTFAAGDGTADATMTFDGTAAAINAALQGLTFDPAANYNGAADVTVTTNDQGNTGTGGALQDSDVVALTVNPVDDPSVARDDLFVTYEDTVLLGSVFADNGFGPDFDVDSPLNVDKVAGQSLLVGQDYPLPGGTLRINADGMLRFTPDPAQLQLAAEGSGASNTSLSYTFEYSLDGGSTGHVTMLVKGVDGADTLLGTSGVDSLHGGLFDDVMKGGFGADLLDGGPGTDTVSYADDGAAVFVNLTLGRGYGNSAEGDTYVGIENVIGSSANDFLIGDPGVNRIDGGAGNDTVIGAVGPDVLIGGAGTDLLSFEDNSGTVFVNLLTGMGYNNAAQGDTFDGFENVISGLFDDTLIGDHGANRLDGAMGADTLVGNGGSDTFVFSYAPGATSIWGNPNVDTIFDFVSGSDMLEINAAAFGGGLSAGPLAAEAFVLGTAAHNAGDRFVYDQPTGHLYYDADGSGAGAQVLMAILPNHDAIAASDFVIV